MRPAFMGNSSGGCIGFFCRRGACFGKLMIRIDGERCGCFE